MKKHLPSSNKAAIWLLIDVQRIHPLFITIINISKVGLVQTRFWIYNKFRSFNCVNWFQKNQRTNILSLEIYWTKFCILFYMIWIGLHWSFLEKIHLDVIFIWKFIISTNMVSSTKTNTCLRSEIFAETIWKKNYVKMLPSGSGSKWNWFENVWTLHI